METQIKHLDFISSICLFLISSYIIGESLRIHGEVGGPMYASPGLLTLFLGSMLLLCSVLLFIKSLKKVGFSANVRGVRRWLGEFIKSKETKRMLLGILILGFFVFFLLPRFPFLLSSFIFLFILMKVMDAGSILKITIISICVSGSIFTLFQIIFKVPLP
ncbi:tripartite tricarboxylate transporter TctB family protein [Bacillus sp. OK048]|uniref:tripartite tricarboxylate transporter TctB family protein n=1 Tax=Bacillus sp. OK048 TaxID=1882761 RepID=UPI00088AEE42|nr:tripartite tricarboxylate transporter TctB family protein [Bacillus sp. OK048]SDN09964.1 Tripartite tricarboxylate transporter TctB family protein [Bacillus sp. OK048]